MIIFCVQDTVISKPCTGTEIDESDAGEDVSMASIECFRFSSSEQLSITEEMTVSTRNQAASAIRPCSETRDVSEILLQNLQPQNEAASSASPLFSPANKSDFFSPILQSLGMLQRALSPYSTPIQIASVRSQTASDKKSSDLATALQSPMNRMTGLGGREEAAVLYLQNASDKGQSSFDAADRGPSSNNDRGDNTLVHKQHLVVPVLNAAEATSQHGTVSVMPIAAANDHEQIAVSETPSAVVHRRREILETPKRCPLEIEEVNVKMLAAVAHFLHESFLA